MEKSKAFEYVKREIKMQNDEMKKELDDDYQDLLTSVKFASFTPDPKPLPKKAKNS